MRTMKYVLTLCAVLLFASPALATNYYAATNGNDTTGDGSASNPWRNPGRFFKTGTPVVAGDTLIVGCGTYTAADYGGTGVVVNIATQGTQNATSGTAGSPITFKPATPLCAKLVVPGASTSNIAIVAAKSWYVIEEFDIDGTGASNNQGLASHTGIQVWGNNITIRRNHIHHISRTVCSTSVYGNSGIYSVADRQNITISHNVFDHIGRLRGAPAIQENGCTLTPGSGGIDQNDHGMYLETQVNLSVHHNICYDTNRGYCLHIYKSGGGGATTNMASYFNLWAMAGLNTPASSPPTPNIVTQTVTGANFKNDLYFAPRLSAMNTGGTPTYSGNTLSWNRMSINENDGNDNFWNGASTPSGWTVASNTDNVSLGLVNASCTQSSGGCESTGFQLASGSSAINAGTAISGFAYNGSAPDQGPFETFSFTGGSALANENFVDVTLGMNVNTPVLPATGQTGWAVTVNAVSRNIVSATRLSGTSSVVRVQFDGAPCETGQTITVANTTGGNVTDSAMVGGWMNQPMIGFTAQTVTNNCGTPGGGGPGGLHIHYLFNETSGTNLNDETANNLDGIATGTITVGGAGKNSFGVVTTDLANGYVAIPYGNTLNPSTQSITTAFWVLVPSNLTSATRTYFGHSGVASNRFYISTLNSTWRIGIQGSNDGASSNLAVVAGWNRVCLQANSGTDIATLYINGTVGSSGAAKAYTSYVVPSNFSLGSPFGATNNPGVTYDDFKLWTTAESCADDWAAAEPPAPPAAIVLTQKRHQFMESHYLPGTTTVQLIGAQQASISKFAGESFALETQTDATVAGGSIAQRLHYSRNGSATKQPVTDDCNTADQICFVGTGTDPTNLLSGTVTCCLTGALTPITGSTEITSDAVPVTTFTINSSTVHRRVLKLGTAALATDTYDFFEYTQQGVAFGTYDPVGGARVTVAGASPGITAPTNLHFSGPTNGSLAALIWSPVTHSGLVAYDIFRGTATGVYDADPTYTVSLTEAALAHSPPTQKLIRLPVADEYFFIVKARDFDGTRSAASSEVSKTVSGMSARAARVP